MEEQIFKDVHNYTKYKLIEMLINKHQSKFKNLNDMEQVVDNVLDVLGVCGMKYHNDLKEEFDNG